LKDKDLDEDDKQIPSEIEVRDATLINFEVEMQRAKLEKAEQEKLF